LKTASISQCRKLTVVCKQGVHIEVRHWDIDHVTDMGEWSLIDACLIGQDEIKLQYWKQSKINVLQQILK
jgi:hypothetical protein